MKICILLGILVILAGAADVREDQQGFLVVSGKECLTLDVSKAELWMPMVDGQPDKKRAFLVNYHASYDPNCGVYRVERVESNSKSESRK